MTCCDLVNVATEINRIDGNYNSDELNEHKSDEKIENKGRLIVNLILVFLQIISRVTHYSTYFRVADVANSAMNFSR